MAMMCIEEPWGVAEVTRKYSVSTRSKGAHNKEFNSRSSGYNGNLLDPFKGYIQAVEECVIGRAVRRARRVLLKPFGC